MMLTVIQVTNKLTLAMEPYDSPAHSQKPKTEPCPWTAKSQPIFLKSFNIVLTCTLRCQIMSTANTICYKEIMQQIIFTLILNGFYQLQ